MVTWSLSSSIPRSTAGKTNTDKTRCCLLGKLSLLSGLKHRVCHWSYVFLEMKCHQNMEFPKKICCRCWSSPLKNKQQQFTWEWEIRASVPHGTSTMAPCLVILRLIPYSGLSTTPRYPSLPLAEWEGKKRSLNSQKRVWRTWLLWEDR